MSNEFEQRRAMERTSEDIARLCSGDMTEQEEECLSGWRSEPEAYQKSFVQTMQLLGEAHALEGDKDLLAMVGTGYDGKCKRSRTSRWPRLAIAATIVLSAMVGLMLWDRADPMVADSYRYVTQIGEQKSINLADGSVIHLNTGTILTVELSSGARRVTMESGEAYFEIYRDGRPFSVTLGDESVSVLGTEFNIRQRDQGFEVAVLEGVVALHPAGERVDNQSPGLVAPNEGEVASEGKYRLEAGTVATYRGNTQPVAVQRPESLSGYDGWRDGILQFEEAPLSVVVAEMNRYSAIPIEIEDPSLAERKIYATVDVRRVDEALQVLEEMLPLKVLREPDRRLLIKE